MSRLNIGFLLFPEFDTLDVTGPAELFGVPVLKDHFALHFITQDGQQVTSALGLHTVPDHSFQTCPLLDVLLVPGGLGTRKLVNNDNWLNWIRQQYSGREKPLQYLLSVCTGSALLGKAGLLDGKKATSNNNAFSWVKSQSDKAHWIKHARWVQDGNILTSSGVTAGMDMTLYFIAKVLGPDAAQSAAAYTEYDGQWTDSTADNWSKQ